VGFAAPLALTWTTNPPTSRDALELHRAGSVLSDASNVACSGCAPGARSIVGDPRFVDAAAFAFER
jgi:hypothetical protein